MIHYVPKSIDVSKIILDLELNDLDTIPAIDMSKILSLLKEDKGKTADVFLAPETEDLSSCKKNTISVWYQVTSIKDIKEAISKGFVVNAAIPVFMGDYDDDNYDPDEPNDNHRIKNGKFCYTGLENGKYIWDISYGVTVGHGKRSPCHAVTILGYNDKTRLFKILNLWGMDRGNDGYVYADYDILMLTGDSSYSYHKPNVTIIYDDVIFNGTITNDTLKLITEEGKKIFIRN